MALHFLRRYEIIEAARFQWGVSENTYSKIIWDTLYKLYEHLDEVDKCVCNYDNFY
jgi:hypothetical protein